jgi:hypothetical protein
LFDEDDTGACIRGMDDTDPLSHITVNRDIVSREVKILKPSETLKFFPRCHWTYLKLH